MTDIGWAHSDTEPLYRPSLNQVLVARSPESTLSIASSNKVLTDCKADATKSRNTPGNNKLAGSEVMPSLDSRDDPNGYLIQAGARKASPTSTLNQASQSVKVLPAAQPHTDDQRIITTVCEHTISASCETLAAVTSEPGYSNQAFDCSPNSAQDRTDIHNKKTSEDLNQSQPSLHQDLVTSVSNSSLNSGSEQLSRSYGSSMNVGSYRSAREKILDRLMRHATSAEDRLDLISTTSTIASDDDGAISGVTAIRRDSNTRSNSRETGMECYCYSPCRYYYRYVAARNFRNFDARIGGCTHNIVMDWWCYWERTNSQNMGLIFNGAWVQRMICCYLTDWYYRYNNWLKYGVKIEKRLHKSGVHILNFWHIWILHSTGNKIQAVLDFINELIILKTC